MRKGRIFRRLLPLYIAAFLQGFVLFYAIEKLFMREIGFDDAGIGMMVAVVSVTMLVIETPSGILADRWSRRNVLIVAGVFLAASALVGGLSYSPAVYFAAAGLWGAFFAMYTGTYDSIVYDTLVEEGQKSDQYEKWYGYVKAVDGAALVAGALLGGVVAELFGLRNTYMLTVPIALLSIAALFALREPTVHKRHEVVPLSHHVRETFGAILRKGRLLYIVGILVSITLMTSAMYEFVQLWWIALALPAAAFGGIFALVTAVDGAGGLMAGWLRLGRYWVMQASLLILLLCALTLLLSRSSALIIAAQVVFMAGVVGLGVALNRMLHDELPSTVRAGASSAISTLARLFLIPFAIVFGMISREVDVFRASWLFVGLLVPCFFLAAKLHSDRKATLMAEASQGNAGKK